MAKAIRNFVNEILAKGARKFVNGILTKGVRKFVNGYKAKIGNSQKVLGNSSMGRGWK